jgi:hypothetical protein
MQPSRSPRRKLAFEITVVGIIFGAIFVGSKACESLMGTIEAIR